MADKRISQLNSHTTPSGSDLLVIVTNNETKKITYADLSSAITGSQTDISALNTFTQSIDSRVDNLESWSSSLDSTFATDLQVSIVSSSVAATIGIVSQNTGLVTTSSFNQYTASISTASLVSRLDVLESNTGSYLTSLNGTISGSSQLTGSYDERYVLSGSITQTTWDNISGKPSGLVSQSTDISSLNAFTASYFTDSSSFDGRITTEKGRIDAILSASTADADTFAEIVTLINSVDTTNDNAFATYYTSSNARISSLENVTSSYETNGRGIVSGSSQLTSSFDVRYTLSGSVQPLPSGLISGSSQLTSSYDSRYSLSGSVLTSFSSSVDNRLDTLEATIISGSINYTQVLGNRRSSITTVGVSIISGSITTTGNPVQIMVTGDANPTTTSWARLQIFRDGNGIGNVIQVENSSNLNVPYCLNVIDTPPAGTYTYSMRTVDSMSGTFDFGEYTGPLLTAVELKSNTQLPSGLISGSSQLTSSYDTRYTLSGSVQPLPSGLFSSSAQLPNGIISGSSQLTASYDTRYTLSGSVSSTPAGTISGSSQLTSSFDGRYVQTGSFNSFTASAVTTGSNSFSGSQTITGSLIVSSVAVVNGAVTIPTGSTISLTSGSNLFVDSSGAITGSFTGSVFGIGDVSAFSSSVNTRLNNITSSVIPAGTISGSSQLTSSFDTRYTLSGSVQPLPSGLISGSSQLTSSFDVRYETIGRGIVSGSSQLTSSYDSRYTLTSSFNSFTASAQAVTTGSNTFNGTQTITGSLNITNGNIVASQITANTASLYLTSGSNMYVQNNGLVEITGSLVVSGSVNIVTTSPLQIGTGSGDEGGEILLAKSATNSTLTGSGITIDSYRDRLRIFEQGGDARGVYIDLAKTPTGVSGELIWKASGMVNAGTFVTLDNIKATVTSSGNRGLSIAAVSTNFTANISAYYAMNGGMAGTSTNNFSVTTTPTTTLFTWNFTAEGDGAYYTIVDKTNNRMYRVTLMIGASYNNNFISIERLY